MRVWRGVEKEELAVGGGVGKLRDEALDTLVWAFEVHHHCREVELASVRAEAVDHLTCYFGWTSFQEEPVVETEVVEDMSDLVEVGGAD